MKRAIHQRMLPGWTQTTTSSSNKLGARGGGGGGGDYTALRVDVTLNLPCSQNVLWSGNQKTSIECISKPVCPYSLYECEQLGSRGFDQTLKGDQRDQ